MGKTIKFLLVFIAAVVFLSCTHADSLYNEYMVEIERPDTTSNINDSTSHDQTKKDTLFLSYEKYIHLSPTVSSSQGGACYGKYFIQCYASNPAIEIYDLEKKTYLCKIVNPYPGTRTHANTAFFGNQKISPDDYFPLLYICSGNSTNVNKKPCSFIHAYRIIKYDNADGSEEWDAQYVYTITLSGFGSWTEGVIDNDKNLLWVKDNGCYYSSFKMPNYEGGNVTIYRDDAITSFSVDPQPFTSSPQGHLFHDNKILLVSGTSPKTQKLAFIVINTLTQTRELVIDLLEIGLDGEPENIFIYKDQLMIGYRGPIYKFNLYPKKK